MRVTSKHWLLAAAVALCSPVSPVSAQEPLQRIKDLYASAAYEDTLAAVTSLPEASAKPEIEQYKIFSLVALGRLPEAQQAVEAVLTAYPLYHPDAADLSPRIQELFKSVRSRVGPEAVKTLYRDGKSALDRKDRETAIHLFVEMLRTADDPDISVQPMVSELRLLGAGFLDLSRALPAPPAVAAAPSPSASPATAAAVSPAAPMVITPAVAIRENLPAWSPSSSSNRAVFSGRIHVVITDTGTVERAEILDSIHPEYDPLLLRAAKAWLYEPARRNGVALPSEKTVEIRLKPRA
jgi:hypothetical protein